MATKTTVENISSRFERKYQPIPWSGCWIWIASTDGEGRYGSFTKDGKVQRAHRVSWEFCFGTIKDKALRVLHKCDVGLCVNPAHLFLGTQRDNVLDMISKGRKNVGSAGKHGKHAKGERNGSARYPDNVIAAVRSDYSSGIANKAELARRHGMSESQVRRIVWNQSRSQ